MNGRTRRGFGAAAAVAACGAIALTGAGAAAAAPPASGTVYVETNAAAGNAVQAFDRAADGTLTPAGAYATGGTGTGAGLGSQGAVALEGDALVAVDAGSGDLAAFRVGPDGLRRTDVAPSGGERPISVTLHDGLLYALNAGGAGNVTGFRLSARGRLVPIPGSTRPLTGDDTDPAQVGFSPDGDTVVVTEKAADVVAAFPVRADGRLGAAVATPSSGATPFGFAFDRRGRLFVSEAFGGAPGASALSSYRLDATGAAGVLSGTAPTLQTAACWVAVTGRYAYAANTGSDSITGYAVSPAGTLTRLDADGVTARTGHVATDLALSRSGRFLYSRGAGDGSITAFRVRPDGGLSQVGAVEGLPTSAVGLAAR